MNIIEDLQWHCDSLPRAGGQCTVYATPTALQAGIAQQLLWTPIYSELNGWDAQPSDIALSEIVTAQLTPTARAPQQDKVEYGASILGRVSLLHACRNPGSDNSCDATCLVNLNSAAFWDQVHWAGTALIDGFTFLDVAAAEATLAMLFVPERDHYSVRYVQWRIDGWSSAALGCWSLQDDAQRAVRRQLEKAVTLKDSRSAPSPSSANPA